MFCVRSTPYGIGRLSSTSSPRAPIAWAFTLRRFPHLMETGQSFTARRPAASHLPSFQLPPPDLSALNKYPAYAATSSATQATPPISSSILTPPSGDVLSPLSSSVSASSQSSAGGVPPYQPNGFWPSSQSTTAFPYSTAPSMPAPFAQPQSYMGRSMYSPSMSFPGRSTTSPTGGPLPPPPYDLNLPPFPTAMGSSGSPHQNLPNLAPQQGQRQHSSNGILSSQAPPRPPLTADPYSTRPASSQPYYNTPASTPQQSSFPAYSPTQQSPNHSQAPRLSPVSAHHPSMGGPQGYNSRPYNGYSLPAMAGPIMSNVHNPGSQMALVGGMNMQYPHPMSGQHMYGHHGQQQQQQNDRPFKCNQCTQGFNRNHDLKRHQRIHLAVKPFPCGHCEKSFSRKDALKVRSSSDSNLQQLEVAFPLMVCERANWTNRDISL